MDASFKLAGAEAQKKPEVSIVRPDPYLAGKLRRSDMFIVRESRKNLFQPPITEPCGSVDAPISPVSNLDDAHLHRINEVLPAHN